LKDYKLKKISYGIDLSVFKPTDSDFREIHGIEDKFILLGVSDHWTIGKGRDIFIELSKSLDDRFKIVLVGTDDAVDKLLPDNILSIHRTANQLELAKIYSASDVFVNPTRADVFGLVNAEALACGIPVITFKTGGSPEVRDDTCGLVVDVKTAKEMEKAIKKVYNEKLFPKEDCIKRAKNFDKNEIVKELIKEY
jgi:glycosyltransferase involved in cell wall biosynthesis